MSKFSAANVARGLILTSLATLMVAGFLLMGGLSSSDSAEAFRCNKKWFDRCPETQTSSTFDELLTTTDAPPTTVTSTTETLDGSLSTSTGGFLNCSKRWFNRCSELTTITLSDSDIPNFPD